MSKEDMRILDVIYCPEPMVPIANGANCPHEDCGFIGDGETLHCVCSNHERVKVKKCPSCWFGRFHICTSDVGSPCYCHEVEDGKTD